MAQSVELNGGRDDGGGGHGDSDATSLAPQNEDTNKMVLCLFLKRHVHYLPIMTFIFIFVSLWVSYGVAVSQGHVEPDFPYISYTALEIPERCIFAQLINIGACLMGANVYVRFMQQRDAYEVYKVHGRLARSPPKNSRLVIASLVCGCLSAFGLSMVANFQTIVMRPPHYVGAGLAFGMGLAYCWLQTSISLSHRPRCDCVTIAQLIISSFLTMYLIIFAVSKTIFKVKEHRGEGTKEVELRAVYLVSTISEWLTAISVVVFALTFYPDFSRLTLVGPMVRVSDDRAGSQIERNGNSIPLNGVSNNHDNHRTSPS